jgi:hypothetical protein
LAEALSGRHVPEGGRAELDETSELELSSSGSSLEEEDSSELELSSLEEDSSSGSELEDSTLLDSGSTEELDSTTGSLEELLSTTSLEEELELSADEISGEADVSITEELLSSAEELLERALCEELLLPDFFQTGRPRVLSHLARHFESARQESIMASSSDGPISPNFSTATISSVSG